MAGFAKHDNPDSPLISVITIVYNGRNDIEKTIASVRRQSYGNIEHIVIDGGSSDGTVEYLCDQYETVDLWESEPDDGPYDAMNKGIKRAGGRILNILNSGDCYSHNEVLKQVIETYKASGHSLIYGQARLLDQPVNTNSEQEVNRYEILGSFPLDKYCYRICHQAMFYEKRMHDHIGLYDTKYKIAAEHKFTLQLINSLSKKPLFLNQVLIDYKGGGLSSSEKAFVEYHMVDREIMGVNMKNEIIFYIKKISLIRPGMRKYLKHLITKIRFAM